MVPPLAGLAGRQSAEGQRPGRRSPQEAQALLKELELDGTLGREECRLACLQLRAAGFSLRQIASQTEISKSSVARLLAGGREALDLRALLVERGRRYPEVAAQFLAALRARARPAEVRRRLPYDR